MTTGPRLLFTAFPDAQVNAAMWSGHAEILSGVPTENYRLPTGAFTVWQLVTANGRAVARATNSFSSFDEANLDARRVVREVASMRIELASHAMTGMHGWSARLGDECVAVCSRWYTNERDCRNAAALALQSLPIARIATSAHVVRPFRSTSTEPLVLPVRRFEA